MKVDRGQFLAGAAATALGAAGIYELVDRLADSPARPAAAPRPDEQHLLSHHDVIVDNGVEVLVPPLHHEVVTARVKPGVSPREAQPALERALRALEREYDASPAGLGVAIAWGIPYFRDHVPAQATQRLPIDVRESGGPDGVVRVLVDTRRFPSDPEDLVLEANDVALLLRSDRLEHIAHGHETLVGGLGIFEQTSVRKGFVGGGFEGRRSLPKQMAVAAGVPGADLIPETAQLFLGFTSTQRQALGPTKIANFETLGFVHDPTGYFRGGTHMHLSHVFEDLEAWYLNFDFGERVATTFRPGKHVPDGTQTVRQAPEDITDGVHVAADFRRTGSIGHSSSIQPFSRLPSQVVGPDGTVYEGGAAIPQRADFNTLDNPFFWTATPERDGWSATPSAGLHFISFNPTSNDFHRNRLAMDGQLPDGTRLPFVPRARGQGFNSVLRASHRQNFLVPPRRHRSFPLAELRA
jgi:hypothetical protein